ncbi:MAG: DUF1003 domain-containing protein [Dehalococcoidia bacterium]|nr:DUF1003 domain-containing protein [Dehalococcoidia bacterium]MCA9856178.1 DUF1003 domain-containing protein [Dehalococcoidia bacterium]MCB9482928.1 DUF1003 domain-containing protein [Dehalococcoidia bacterium]MCB9491437.1 DUF1003 domain-containing protein [Dehalococcoidia bacterium]
MKTVPVPSRRHIALAHLGAPFGSDRFGRFAERFARGFGNPQFLVAQTLFVVAWIGWNAATVGAFDPFPFILLNLAFSTQAAYAAPLILLAQTRQADRDRAWSDADMHHREELSAQTLQLVEENTSITQQVHTLLVQNTELTQQVADLTQRIEQLTEAIHGRVLGPAS